MKDDQTEAWLSVIERIMVINLQGRREEDMDELMELLARLDALQDTSRGGGLQRHNGKVRCDE